MRVLPDRSCSCLSLCDIAYTSIVYGFVHLSDNDFSCSVLYWFFAGTGVLLLRQGRQGTQTIRTSLFALGLK